MDTQVTVDHSVYRPTCFHVSGAEIDHEDLGVVLTSAEQALGREEGVFIHSLDQQFVVGFLKEWSMDDGAPRGGEFFYNLFSIDLDDAQRIDLRVLVKELSEHAVEDRNADVEGSFVVSVPENTSREDNHHAVAEILHQLHNEPAARASLDELTQLKNHVNGILRHLRYISNQREETGYFNIIGGDRGKVISDDEIVQALVEADGPVQFERLRSTTEVEPDLSTSSPAPHVISNRQLLLVVLTIQVILVLLVLFDVTFEELYNLVTRIARIWPP